MKKRGLALFVALLLAAGATVAVFLYVEGVRRDATAAPKMVRVVVPKRDIAAGTQLDGLISAGAFTTLDVPESAVVSGAITDLSQLQGRTTSTFILQDEQISTARLRGSTQATGGVLGIPKGYQAVSFQQPLAQVVGGVLQPGDHITIYGSFDSTLTAKFHFHKTGPTDTGDIGITGQGQLAGGEVLVVVPDVQVLKIAPVPNSTGGSDLSQKLVTLALLPQDVERVLYAGAQGHVWFSLLPPGEQGQPQPPVTFQELNQQQPQEVAP
jgi:Flp pilus assembly protein CpaB